MSDDGQEADLDDLDKTFNPKNLAKVVSKVKKLHIGAMRHSSKKVRNSVTDCIARCLASVEKLEELKIKDYIQRSIEAKKLATALMKSSSYQSAAKKEGTVDDLAKKMYTEDIIRIAQL